MKILRPLDRGWELIFRRRPRVRHQAHCHDVRTPSYKDAETDCSFQSSRQHFDMPIAFIPNPAEKLSYGYFPCVCAFLLFLSRTLTGQLHQRLGLPTRCGGLCQLCTNPLHSLCGSSSHLVHNQRTERRRGIVAGWQEHPFGSCVHSIRYSWECLIVLDFLQTGPHPRFIAKSSRVCTSVAMRSYQLLSSQ
mgnify:CR=1 FL=1